MLSILVMRFIWQTRLTVTSVVYTSSYYYIMIIIFQSGKNRYYNTEEESIINMSTEEKSVVESSASSDAKQQQCSSSSIIPSQKVKLILPELTPAMQQDLALVKTGLDKPLKPLSIANRPEYVNYPLENVVTPHPHDVCKCIYYALNVLIQYLWCCSMLHCNCILCLHRYDSPQYISSTQSSLSSIFLNMFDVCGFSSTHSSVSVVSLVAPSSFSYKYVGEGVDQTIMLVMKHFVNLSPKWRYHMSIATREKNLS